MSLTIVSVLSHYGEQISSFKIHLPHYRVVTFD